MNAVLVTLAFCLTSFCILVRAVQLWRSPLFSAKDAHWSAKYTGAWIWWQRVVERDTRAVHEAHVRLGPVVRLGPNEISINDVDGGLKPIYEGRLPKTNFYQVANSYGEEPMVAMKDEVRHRQQKKLVAKPYGNSYMTNIREWYLEQTKLAEDLVFGLEKLVNADSELELYDVFFAWSVASISAYIFGGNGSLNLLHDIPEARRVREEYFSQRAYQFVGVVLPIPPRVFDWLGYQPELRWIRQMQDRAEQTQKSKHEESDTWTTPYDYMKRGINTGAAAKQDSVLSAEMQDNIIAGIDTSTAALAACSWLLSQERNRHWQDQLRVEIRSVQGPSPFRNLDQLSVLNSIIKETLRLYPPVAGGQPRVTDKTIVLGPQGHEVTVTPGIKVHCQAQSLHRSSIFEDADNFHPERWLNNTTDKRKEMDRWFWAFGSGSRRCLGEHLGWSNLRVAIAAIWENFETLATSRTQLTVSEGIVAMPLPSQAGDYIRLRLRKVERTA